MGMQLNTGDTGRAVSPAADGSLYSKIFGSGCYVLSGGNELKAEIQSNNLIKIYDGDLIMQGRHSYIPASDSDNVTINNGSQGMNRKDLIVARYTKDSTGVEDVTLQVVQGMATSGAATAPGYTDGDILKGATAKDFPLYEVSLTGINITEVKKLFKVLGTNEDLDDKVTELNGNKPSFFHHELLWTGKLTSKKSAAGMSPNWSKYTLFVCRFDGGVSMALGIRCKDDASTGWKDWIRFIGGNDSGSGTDVYVASVMISGDTITAAGIGSHALTSTGCPGVDRIMCEIYGII